MSYEVRGIKMDLAPYWSHKIWLEIVIGKHTETESYHTASLRQLWLECTHLHAIILA